MKKTFEQRFWEKVDIRSDDECWNWKAYKNKAGYGKFQLNKTQGDYAHRVSYKLNNGKIEDGLSVLHSCDNPSCVNPKHLRIGTQKDNIGDAVERLRHPGFKLYGIAAPNVRLTELQVQKIMLLRGCFSEQRISEFFDVKRPTIGSIYQGKTWRHITSSKQALA